MQKKLNFAYSCCQGSYWMIYAPLCSFASVFLLAKGYSNSEIGVVFALSNILAALLQPVAADVADRSRRFSVIDVVRLFTLAILAATGGIFLLKGRSLLLSLTCIAAMSLHISLQPLINTIPFRLSETGYVVGFGLGRSIGSACYSLAVFLLGVLVDFLSESVLPLASIFSTLLLLASLRFTNRAWKSCTLPGGTAAAAQKEKDQDISLVVFLKKHKIFFVINIGIFSLYISNSVLNNYMAQIVSSAGGSHQDLGRILSLMALLEIPVLACFHQLKRRFSCQRMIVIAAFFYIVKTFLCYAASSVALIYVAQVFQMFSFALLLPSMVHFIDQIMEPGEAVKGQAFYITSTTAANIVASLAGGGILDVLGVKPLLLISLAFSAAGTLLIAGFISKTRQA